MSFGSRLQAGPVIHLAKYSGRQQLMPAYLKLGCMVALLAISTGCSTDLMRTIDPEQPILLSKDFGIIVGSITGMQEATGASLRRRTLLGAWRYPIRKV